MDKARIRFQRKKVMITLLHILFLGAAVTGILAILLNDNYGKGFRWIKDEVYEDSESFSAQLAADLDSIFDYIGYRDLFETDGRLDMNKVIVGISNGPGVEEEFTLEKIISYAKTRGYYLDGNFALAGVPWSMEDDEDTVEELTVNFQSYNPEYRYGHILPDRMTKEELALDILGNLGSYYSIYYNYIEKDTNLHFKIVYEDEKGAERVYANDGSITVEKLKGYGKYLYIRGDSVRIDSNLATIPSNAAPLLEIWNPNGNDKNYMIVAVDTSYPNTDSYSVKAAEFKHARSQFIWGLAGVTIGVVGCLSTLTALMYLCGHIKEGDDEIRLHPVDAVPTEVCILLWACAAAAFLYAGRYFGNRVFSLFLMEEHWDYCNKLIKLLILYGSMVLCGFALLRRYKARTLWSNSLAKRVIEASREYIGRVPYAVGAGFCYVLFLGFNAAMMVCILLLLAAGGEKISGRILFYVCILFTIGLDGWSFHKMFRKAVQRDVIDEAISSISQGNTEYQIDISRLSGKEHNMGEHINNISSGLSFALQEQVKSERLKADLITNVSHDIKTPLTSIINYVDLLKREKIKDPKIAAYLEVLDQKSQRLKTLTEDLVEASKASSGNLKLEVSDINFVELVHQTNGEFEERFALRHLELVSGLPEDALIIRADGRRLWRVLENLYTNAFKYAMEHSRVYVDVKEKDGQVIFTIKNVSENPLNISPDELTERFVRGDVARTTEGSGLGLSIAQSLTQLQNGFFQISIDGDLFKAAVAFPVERSSRRQDRLIQEALREQEEEEAPGEEDCKDYGEERDLNLEQDDSDAG